MPFYNNAEGGVDGVVPTITDTGSGDQWSEVNHGGVAGRIEYTNVAEASGLLGYRCYTRGTAENESVGITNGSTVTSSYGSICFLVDVSDIVNGTRLVNVKNTAAGFTLFYVQLSTAEKITLRHGTDLAAIFTSVTTIAANNWYRVEWFCSVDGSSNATVNLRIFNGLGLTPAEPESGNLTSNIQSATSVSNYNYVRYGCATTQINAPSTTGILYFDEARAFDTNWTTPQPMIYPPDHPQFVLLRKNDYNRRGP